MVLPTPIREFKISFPLLWTKVYPGLFHSTVKDTLFVFSISDPKQNARSLLNLVSKSYLALSLGPFIKKTNSGQPNYLKLTYRFSWQC